MISNEVYEIFDRHYGVKFDYRVPGRESVRYNYSNSVVVAIAFCSIWLICRLKYRWLTSAECSLCNRIAEIWKRDKKKKVDNSASRAIGSPKSIVTPTEADDNHVKNTNGLNKPQVGTMNDQLDATLSPDINNFAQMTQRRLMLENVCLRRQLLTSEMKLYTLMKQTTELRKRLLHVKVNEIPRETPIKAPHTQRRRSSFFDHSTKHSNIWSRGVNGNSTKVESTGSQQTIRSLKDNVCSSELVSFIAKFINQKEEVIEKLLKHTEELLELNENLRLENMRMKRESGFKVTRSSSVASSSSNISIGSSAATL